jgi:8-hydroxy-5-deazaflavin:NADPH oxidoreductase
MTRIGILGTGRVGTGLARAFTAAGHRVTLGRRSGGTGPDAPPADTAARYADHARTAREADVVVNATPGEGAPERLAGLRAELDGRILVDVSNAVRHGADGLPGDLLHPGGSLAERLQAALPGTRVVKTLNTMLFTVMTAPGALAVPPTAFLSGDDEGAKAAVAALLADLGWRSDWIEDLGGIATARATEAMVLVVPHVLRRGGFAPFAVSLAR